MDPSVLAEGQATVRLSLPADDGGVLPSDRLSAAAGEIGISSYSRQVLEKLVGKASPDAVMKATRHVSSPSDRYPVLRALAKAPLQVAEADRLAGLAAELEVSSYQSRVLVALADKCSPKALAAAARRISSSSDRAAVLDKLAERIK